jgi:hypothetical protein
MTTPCQYKLLSPAPLGNAGQDLLEGMDQGEGLRRIQALLAHWLRMENCKRRSKNPSVKRPVSAVAPE